MHALATTLLKSSVGAVESKRGSRPGVGLEKLSGIPIVSAAPSRLRWEVQVSPVLH